MRRGVGIADSDHEDQAPCTLNRVKSLTEYLQSVAESPSGVSRAESLRSADRHSLSSRPSLDHDQFRGLEILEQGAGLNRRASLDRRPSILALLHSASDLTNTAENSVPNLDNSVQKRLWSLPQKFPPLDEGRPVSPGMLEATGTPPLPPLPPLPLPLVRGTGGTVGNGADVKGKSAVGLATWHVPRKSREEEAVLGLSNPLYRPEDEACANGHSQQVSQNSSLPLQVEPGTGSLTDAERGGSQGSASEAKGSHAEHVLASNACGWRGTNEADASVSNAVSVADRPQVCLSEPAITPTGIAASEVNLDVTRTLYNKSGARVVEAGLPEEMSGANQGTKPEHVILEEGVQ